MKRGLLWLCLSCLLPLVALAQPNVNLGADTTVCTTTWVLDATTPNASYSWSTGATTPTLTVTSSGLYWVAVTDGTGTTRDSIRLVVSPTPVLSYLPLDTALCQGLQWLSVSSTGGLVEWLDSAFNRIAIGDTLSYLVQDTALLYYRARYLNQALAPVGLSTSLAPTGFVSLDRGIEFDVLQPLQFNSLRLQVNNGPFTAQLSIENAQGQTVFSTPINLPAAGVHTITLNTVLPVGNGYRLYLRNITGGNARFNNPINNWSPYQNSAIRLVGGLPFASVYAYFYDWEVAVTGNTCASPLDSIQINGLAIPNLQLGNDTTLCADSLVLDASSGATNYTWNTTANTPQITVYNSGTYSVTASLGGICSVSDSIRVDLQQRPMFTQRPSDRLICQGIEHLVAQANVGVVQWLDSNSNVIGLGDTLRYDAQDTAQLYFRAGYLAPLGQPIGLSTNGAGSGFVNLNRGIEFNMLAYAELTSVRLQIDNGPFTAQLSIEDAQGRVLYSLPINLPSAGVHTVAINMILPPGNGYQLHLRNISGGNARFNNPINNWSPFQSSAIQLVGGLPFPSVYAYFYDWQISTLGNFCATPVDSVRLNVLPTPHVNLGVDTTLCNSSLVLDAGGGSSNVSYTWNTMATTRTITVNTSGVYRVTVSEGGLCTDTASRRVDVVLPPNFTRRPTTQTVCRSVVELVASSNAGAIQWTDDNQTTLYVGDTLNFSATDSTTLYYQARYWVPTANSIGRDFNTGTPIYTNLERGIAFDVLDFLELSSVQLDVDQAPFTATVVVEDAQGQILYQQGVNWTTTGVQTLNIGLALAPANGYSIHLRNISAGRARLESGVNNWSPYQNSLIRLQAGVPFASVYGYFYNWQIATLSNFCASSLDSVQINVLPTPTVALGSDTALCSSSLVLDATNVGGTYTWSNNATTPTITVTSSGLYAVTVTQNGQCAVSDSIEVLVLQQPSFIQRPSDQSACREQVTLTAQTNLGVVQWLDSTGQVIQVGDTLRYDLQDTTRLYYQAGYYQPALDAPGADFTAVATAYINLDRGIEFEVLDFVRLDQVQIDINQAPFLAEVVLEDDQGRIIYQAPLNFSTPGFQTIPLGLSLQPGVDYVLSMRNISGGAARVTNPINNWNIYSTAEVRLIGGAPFSSVYGYFYNWRVSTLNGFCTSGVDSVLLDVLPTPTIDLPADTLVCNDSIFLDITQPNATYTWTPSAITTGSITITQEDNYRVTASIGSCQTVDSIAVFLTPEPSPVLLSADTTTCVGFIERRATGADVLNWYDAPTGGNLVGQGAVFDYLAQATDTIWLQGQNYANKLYTQGLTDTFVTADAGYYFPNTVRGLVFDAETDILLESVTMYINQTALVATIALWDENDLPIDSQSIILTNLGANVVPLNFEIPKGQDYKLMMTRYNVVSILSEFPYNNFPVQGDYVTIRSGIPFSNVYQYFYDWKVKTTSCAAPRQPNAITVLPTPNIDFPVDSVICGNSLSFDASATGATSYQWSNGANTATIQVDSTQTLTLVGAIGTCTDTGTINIFIVEPPSLLIPPNDTVVCQGNLTLRASGNAAYYAWYDSLQAATPFALGDSIRINITDSTTLWMEGVGFLLQTKPLGLNYQPNLANRVWIDIRTTTFTTRGMDVQVNSPILLNSVDVYTDTSMTAELVILKDGFPYYNRPVSLSNVGLNPITIDTLLEGGVYRLLLANPSDGSLLGVVPFGNSRLQQLNTPEVTFLGSTPLPNQYVYFFDWRISTPSCATARVPVRIDVPPSPVLTMVADTATCTASSLVLDPVLINDPLYAYQWSTGVSSDTLLVNASGYYEVTVTNNGRCASIQNTYVQFLATPARLTLNDTTICSPQQVDLGRSVTDGIVVWYDSSDLRQMSYLTAPYPQYISDTTTYWLDVAPRAVTRLGTQAYPDPTENTAYLSFILANTFDVEEYAVLDSVAIYVAQAPATVDWVIMDSMGNTLYTGVETITRAREKVFLPLNALLAPSQGYQMSFNSISTPFLVDQTPPRRPTSSASIAKLTGTVFSGVAYTAFFDWHFSYAFPDCHALADSFTVRIALPIALPDSLFACDSARVSAQHPNASSYQWSTGETTPQITLQSAGDYYLTVSDGGTCTLLDTLTFLQPQPVGLPTSSAVCGNQLSTNYGSINTQFLWNTGATTPTITLTGPNIYSVTVTTPEGCTLVDSTYIAQLVQAPAPQLGGNRTACFTETLDAGLGGQGMSYLWSTGAITQRLVVNQTGLYSVTVTHPLGCSGTDAAYVTIDTLPTAGFAVTKSNLSVLLNNTSTGSISTTYEWWVGDGTVYTIPNPFHTYADTGCYTVRLIAIDICGRDTVEQRIGMGRPDTSCTINVQRLPDATTEGLHLVPNPNAGQFELWLDQPLRHHSTLRLYNSQGQVVAERQLAAQGQRWSIAVPELPVGVYVIQLTDQRSSRVQRLVIQRG